MSIQANGQLASAGEFAEGAILSLAKGTWFCTEHETTVRNGRECAWCAYNLYGEDGFEKWAKTQHLTR